MKIFNWIVKHCGGTRWCPNCKSSTPHHKIGEYWFMCQICGSQHA